MSEPVVHHYVPKFYFKPWCDANGEMVCYRRVHGGKVVVRRLVPDATAHEPHLNSLVDMPPERTADFEKDLARHVDAPGAKAIQQVISGDGKLTDAEFNYLIRFILALRYRTPEVIRHLRHDTPSSFREMIENAQDEYGQIRQGNDPPTSLEFLDKHKHPSYLKNIGFTLAAKLIFEPKRGRELTEMEWFLRDTSASSRPVLTSDRPLIMRNMLQRTNSMVLLPLSPKHVLIGCRDAENVMLKIDDGGTTAFVKIVNGLVVGQAKERCYGTTLALQSFVERRLGKIHHLLPYAQEGDGA